MKVIICIFLIITTVYAHGGSYGGGEHGGGGYGSGGGGHGGGGYGIGGGGHGGVGYGGGEGGFGGYGGGRHGGGGYGVGGHGGGGPGGYGGGGPGGVAGGYGGGVSGGPGSGGHHESYGGRGLGGHGNNGGHHHDFGHNGNDQFEIEHGHNSQEQVDIGQEELESHVLSGSGHQQVVTGSTYNRKPGGKVVVIETTRQFDSKPTHTVNTGSSWQQTGEAVLTESNRKHGKDEQTDIGFGNGQQEQVEIGQEELHSGSGYQQVVTGSTYNRKPGGKVVVIETTRQFSSKPTQTVNTGSSWHQTGETVLTESNRKHGKDEQTDIGFGNGQQELVEIGQEELHSGSVHQQVETGSTYNKKPGGKVVVIETTRQFGSKPLQTVNTGSSWQQPGETFSSEGNIKHGKDEQIEIGQEQVEIGQEKQSGLLHSGSGNQRVITSSTYNQKPGGKFVVVETTRQFTSSPTHKIETTRHHTSETFSTGGINSLGKDDKSEFGFGKGQQEQIEIGQEEESDLLHSGSGNQKVITSSTYNQKPGEKVVVVETTRQFSSKPTQTVNVESSWHKTGETVLAGGNPKDEQQEQVEIGQEQELEVEKLHGFSQSGYHTIVTDTTSSHKQNEQVVIESTREIESKPTQTSIYKSVEKHTSQGNVNDVSDEFKQNLSKPDDKVVGYVQITREFSSKPTEAVSHEQVTKEVTTYGKNQNQQFHNTKG